MERREVDDLAVVQNYLWRVWKTNLSKTCKNSKESFTMR